MVFYLNLTSNCRNPKFTLGGKVQNWISGIDTLPKPQAIKTHSSASILPSTLFSHLTKTSKVTIQSAISAEATDKAGDVLVGGFDDDEPEDDSLECQMAQSTVEKGRRAAVIFLLFIGVYTTDTFYRPIQSHSLSTIRTILASMMCILGLHSPRAASCEQHLAPDPSLKGRHQTPLNLCPVVKLRILMLQVIYLTSSKIFLWTLIHLKLALTQTYTRSRRGLLAQNSCPPYRRRLPTPQVW
jgi:hypothetical protein